ncbi:hypothetical protein CYMTET_34455 [Cymbomonas tetramitiformis]|uniref:Protein kinase domain-containing protein n=1 Tax=Cymbomonas tetramitiformis TaxID=36881 RepID=A0AAE0KPY5_9CHLO|nr:hypothetical protein CYMTET_34455 [Cymbomonas tetramitiformis]|eukprot:gene18570-22169_t
MFDCCEDYTSVYLFMEYCEGGDLLTRLKDKGCFNERVSARIIRQLAEAVQECHKKGIMHRDVKPENVLLTDNSESPGVKLTDFGLSTFFSPGQKFLGERHMVGTTLYAAPEVLKQLYSEEADVWSCGVTLYVMLCGRLPFNGDTEDEIFQAVLVGHLDLQSAPWHTIPETAKEVVEGLLNRAPKHRITLGEFLTHQWIIPAGGLSIFQKLKEMSDDKSFSQRYRRFSSSVSNSFRRTVAHSFDGGSRPLVQAPTKFSSPAGSTQRSHTVVARVSG